jgi:hypothetical protein
MRAWLIGIAVASGCGLIGCSGKSGSDSSAATSAQSAAIAAASSAIAVPANASPDQVVTVFLNALRAGDKATTASLLTGKAREETAKRNLDVDPQAAPDAKYVVRPAEMKNSTGAHVLSVWTERYQNERGEMVEANYEIVWVLRRETEGWRLAGMATELAPGQDPQFLNFEDPEDMIRKRDEAIAAMQPPAAQTAQQPQNQSGPPPAAVER